MREVDLWGTVADEAAAAVLLCLSPGLVIHEDGCD